MKRALQQIKEEVASSKPSEISNNNLVTKENCEFEHKALGIPQNSYMDDKFTL